MTVMPSTDALQHPEWLGAWLGDLRVAFPTDSIHAVFSTQNKSDLDSAIDPLDVLVHAGVPVFLMPATDCLATQFVSPHPPPPIADGTLGKSSWVVSFQPQGLDSQLAMTSVGCRFQGIRGPFRAPPQDGCVSFDGISWPIWTPRTTI